MGRKIDLANLTNDDVPFLIQRPWLVKQALIEGHEIPEGFYGDHHEDETPWVSVEDHGAGAPASDITGKTLDEEDEDEYDSLTIPQLKEELEKRGLTKSGSKPDLVARLREDDEELDDEDDEDSDTEG